MQQFWTVLELLHFDESGSQGPARGSISIRGIIAAYAAAGSAIKRVRTMRRMIVGSVQDAFCLLSSDTFIDFYRITCMILSEYLIYSAGFWE